MWLLEYYHVAYEAHIWTSHSILDSVVLYKKQVAHNVQI